jgi:hypothetical protein
MILLIGAGLIAAYVAGAACLYYGFNRKTSV